ncbi:MAG: oligosaccharide flippase family protein [Puniceicoccaceae bacterium]
MLVKRAKVGSSTIWNLLGFLLPLVAAVLAFPLLLDRLGGERVGGLTIITLVVGFMGLFDFGLGKAQTWFLAKSLQQGYGDRLSGVFWAGVWSVLVLSILQGGLLYSFSRELALVWGGPKVEPGLLREFSRSLEWVALAVPAIMLSPILMGTLEAFDRFRRINLIRIPIGMCYFLAPAVVSVFSPRLDHAVISLVVVRALQCAGFFLSCTTLMSRFWACRPDLGTVLPLFRFGTLSAISTVANNLVMHSDRLIIGRFLGLAIVPFYAIPAEVILRTTILAKSLVSVLFPRFSEQIGHDPTGAGALLLRGARILTFALTVVLFGFVTGGPLFLTVWMGAEFAAEAVPVMDWLARGIFLISLSWLAVFFIEASGRPSWMAGVYLAQLPLYLAVVILTVESIGVAGVAALWTVRAGLDVFIGYRLSGRIAGQSRSEYLKFFGLVTSVILASWLPSFTSDPFWRLFLGGGVFLLLLGTLWRWVAEEGEKGKLEDLARKLVTKLRRSQTA